MSLQDDIDDIKALEDAYFLAHGDYFETDNANKIKIPAVGMDVKLEEFTKFKPNKDKAVDIKKIKFKPKEKDYRFTIGQVVFVNSEEGGYEAGAEKRAYVIIAERKNALGTQVERHTYYGGDQSVIDGFTDGDSDEVIDYTPEID